MITEQNLETTLTEYGIPESMHGGFRRYLFDSIRPGRFLQAVFANDFVNVMGQADDDNRQILFKYADVLYNELPNRDSNNAPWGSPEVVEDWISNEKVLHKQ